MREARHTGHKGRTMRYLFGHYILDTQRAELSGAGTPIKLRRQAFQVLAYLLRHRDRVVPKHELLAHLWPEQFVGDEALKSCVKTLRKALGEQGRAPHFVRTLYGQGYRFVAAVEERLPVPDAPPSGPVPCPALPAVSPPACPAASAPPPPLPLPTNRRTPAGHGAVWPAGAHDDAGGPAGGGGVPAADPDVPHAGAGVCAAL